MLNHIVIMGRLTWDPELRYTQSQIPVTSFRVAVDRDYGGRDGGERQTDFIDCVAWRSTAEFVHKYFSKGSMIVVSGRLQVRDWTDKENNRRTTAEIVADNIYFGESRRRDNDGYRASDNSRGDGYRGGGDYRGGNDNRRGNDNYRGGNDGYRGSNDGYRGGNSDGGYRGNSGSDNYGGGNDSFRSFDDSSAGSGFTELSDTDGELPF